MTETEIRNYIKSCIPSISFEGMMEIRNRFVYENVDLDEAIREYK